MTVRALIVLQPLKIFPKMNRPKEASTGEFQLRFTVKPSGSLTATPRTVALRAVRFESDDERLGALANPPQNLPDDLPLPVPFHIDRAVLAIFRLEQMYALRRDEPRQR
jgi:hypothetical protein